MKVLLTGACGFVGAHITEELLKHEDAEVVALDKLSYAGRLDRLAHLDTRRIRFVYADFSSPLTDKVIENIGTVDYIIHNGACSHVLRSFDNPKDFVDSNAMGTLHMLEAARKLQPKKFIYVSTDEVFGAAQEKLFKETDPLNPTNPYAATKAGGEMLVYAYFRSFQVPTIITRSSNVFGERQHVEKYVPKIIKQMLNDERVDVQVSANGEMGSRQWLYAGTQAKALVFLLKAGVGGETYHIAGVPVTNFDMAYEISKILGKDLWCRFVTPKVPVHDLNYAIDGSKLDSIWKSPIDFKDALQKTVRFSMENLRWLEG